VKSQKTIVLAITANVTSSGLTCGSNTSGAWVVAAYTGTALNGDAFTRDPAQTADPTTTIANTCTLAFDPSPVDSAVGADIPVGVKVLDAVGAEVITERAVSLSVPGTTVTGSPDTTHPFTFSVNGASPGAYTATASSDGFTSITANFTLFDPASSISGQKWRDHDNDGERDDDERGLQYWTIGAYQEGTLISSDDTDEDGNYTIGGLSAGETYTVCEIAPAELEGFEYRGWIQSVPSDPDDVCADIEGAEPNGYTVTFPGGTGSTESDVDFFNVRTITIPEDPDTVEIDCGELPEGGVFTVGDGETDPVGTITVDPDACKPGEYVFETWTSGGEQFAEFYPTFDASTFPEVPFVETYEWVINGDRTQQTLFYDDDPDDATGFREMLFCVVDGDGDFTAFPEADSGPAHTSCLLNTTEDPTEDGVLRYDTVYTEIDGARRLA
jgi:hypothetical protein